MPLRSALTNADEFYATALRERTHWTWHPSRCIRLLLERRSIEAYACEALVAGMEAAQ